MHKTQPPTQRTSPFAFAYIFETRTIPQLLLCVTHEWDPTCWMQRSQFGFHVHTVKTVSFQVITFPSPTTSTAGRPPPQSFRPLSDVRLPDPSVICPFSSDGHSDSGAAALRNQTHNIYHFLSDRVRVRPFHYKYTRTQIRRRLTSLVISIQSRMQSALNTIRMGKLICFLW